MNAFTSPKAAEGHKKPAHPVGCVGPNAITRMAEALDALESDGERRRIFDHGGLARYLETPPTQMVDESEVAALHRSVFLLLGPARMARVSREAGRLTGDYLLANRIPRAAQTVLGILPRAIAVRILLAAVGKHAWTFAGSGKFSWSFSPQLVLRLEGSPICRQLRADAPACDYFAGTFERLFQAILDKRTRVVETECEAAGAPACLFQVEW